MKLIKSWIEGANSQNTNFPLNNLPFGVCYSEGGAPYCCTAVGDNVLNLAQLHDAGYLPKLTENVFASPSLNEFMASGPALWSAVRSTLLQLLSSTNDNAAQKETIKKALRPMTSVTMLLPFKVSEYTDFYSGRQHAQNVGTMFRGPENALPPNWLHIPIGYNGRASTVVVSGTDIHRPHGQLKAPDADTPHFGPCKRLDIELEMGAVIGVQNEMGQPVTVAEADAMIFGYVLLNDWSARDIQAWEYQPLGPFQAKAFATSISPWVVTKEALAPFRLSTPEREYKLLPYLIEDTPLLYDIDLAVHMQPADAETATTVSNTNYKNMYYSFAQQLAHHAIGGCKMNIGDLLGSGTISGADKSGYGSLLEICWGGKQAIELAGGQTRTFIEDGDTLTLTGHAQGDGYRIGFGECTGTILPAVKLSH